jgi:DNA-binding response OmpR family regulator
MAQPAARILVVDDERFFREAIGDALTAAGMDCVLASTGAEALEQAMDEGIGVLLLDVQLPDLSGIEVLRRLRETRPRLRVIIVSSHTDQEYVLDALRLGASDYLAKPIHDEELVLAVRRALQDHDVASRWDRLRGRLGALEYHVSQLTDMGRSCHGHEGRALLRDYAARAAAEILEAARTSIMLLDDAKGVLRVAAAVGEKVPIRDMDVVPVGEQVAGVVFARGEPLVVGDITQEHRVAVAAPEGRYATKSFAITPLRSGERSLGVLCATDRPGGDSFDETDLALLRILSLQVSRLLDDLDRMEAEAADSDALGLSEGTGIAPDACRRQRGARGRSRLALSARRRDRRAPRRGAARRGTPSRPSPPCRRQRPHRHGPRDGSAHVGRRPRGGSTFRVRGGYTGGWTSRAVPLRSALLPRQGVGGLPSLSLTLHPGGHSGGAGRCPLGGGSERAPVPWSSRGHRRLGARPARGQWSPGSLKAVEKRSGN